VKTIESYPQSLAITEINYHKLRQITAMKTAQPFPYALFRENYVIGQTVLLTGKNFPYMNSLNMGILHAWENGIITKVAEIDEYVGY